LTELGECDLAWMAADRGLRRCGASDPDGSEDLAQALGGAAADLWSVCGSLFLAGAMASSRMEGRSSHRRHLGRDRGGDHVDVIERQKHIGVDVNAYREVL
jgi:hypothetical protein